MNTKPFRLLLACLLLSPGAVTAEDAGPVLLIHGGAGTLRAADMSAADRAAYEAALHAALEAGWQVLADGGSALDAVTAAILPMEDSPLFNAGRGAVFTADGHNELDASIMDGATREAGAIGGVRWVRNPVLLARRVMEASPHVFLAGQGALAFAIDQGLELKPSEWFWTERRWQQMQRATLQGARPPGPSEGRFGTVGAVALDAAGRLAAATSTGGTTAKRYGRLGDVPVIGAGTWADRGCAVSATGDGEYFIRAAAASSLCARMALAGESPEEAAWTTLAAIRELGGLGGVIVLDGTGRASFAFTTEGMYRGRADAGGRRVAIFAAGEQP
ncbi:isoaspartyl peptidase/L-asparaginase [Wenzhouxiangella sp. XN24]|uniref:isoaspartyl peptidase/L-asparaginase family protein n=1 Tax=Wenzhouxiangella sp. XN24 TaxID=2713569 RepID=UPI0013EAFDC3|nr:isoaspartyl peptidase/L-asparaginase [Wenzhouxiangella sp. XN24]NGX17244.1 isoaspartyl peptidase/L-asparaginase [Wenzhouxiangella sp. XN24]